MSSTIVVVVALVCLLSGAQGFAPRLGATSQHLQLRSIPGPAGRTVWSLGALCVMKGGSNDGVGNGRKAAVGGTLRRLGAAVWDSRSRALAAVVGLFAVLLLPARRAVAATVATVKGYGLYGRVPYDDWLFATSRLIDPDLLKRSFPELIAKELPIVLRNFKKRRLANELVVIVKGAAYLVAFLALFNLVYQSSLASIERAKRSGGGRPFSASAISKKGPRKGRQIEGMEDGWLDMDLTADEEDEKPPEPPKKPKK